MSTATFVLDTDHGREHFLAGVLGYISGVRHITIGHEHLIVTIEVAIRTDAGLMMGLLRNLLYVKAVRSATTDSHSHD